jgi:hypothetical protein
MNIKEWEDRYVMYDENPITHNVFDVIVETVLFALKFGLALGLAYCIILQFSADFIDKMPLWCSTYFS